MRTHPLFASRHVRGLVLACSLVLAAGCGSGGSSGTAPIPNPGSNNYCDANALGVTLARPQPGSSGVPTSTNAIEIVSYGNGDQLFSSYSQFDVVLADNFGNQIVTNFLTLTSDRGGYAPYPQDFYYQGTLRGSLAPGTLYSAYLNAPNTNCTPLPLGQFST